MITTFCPKCHRPYDVSLGECPVCSRRAAAEHNQKKRKKLSLAGKLGLTQEPQPQAEKAPPQEQPQPPQAANTPPKEQSQPPQKPKRAKMDPDATVILQRPLIPDDQGTAAEQTAHFTPTAPKMSAQKAPDATAAPPYQRERSSVAVQSPPVHPIPRAAVPKNKRPASKNAKVHIPVLAIVLCTVIVLLLVVGGVSIMSGLGSPQVVPAVSSSESASASKTQSAENSPASSGSSSTQSETQTDNTDDDKDTAQKETKSSDSDSQKTETNTDQATTPVTEPDSSGDTNNAGGKDDSSKTDDTSESSNTDGGMDHTDNTDDTEKTNDTAKTGDTGNTGKTDESNTTDTGDAS